MKKILGLTIAAILVIAMVAAGTFAYFNDTEASTGNLITAGTLNLVPAMNGAITGTSGTYAQSPTLADGVDGHVTFDKVSPGNTGTVEWVLYNSGNLAGNLSLAASTVSFNENTDNQPETVAIASNAGVNLGLGDLMGVWVQVGIGTSQATAEAAMTNKLGTTTGYVPLSGLQTALTSITTQAMAASGGSNYVVIKINWKLATDLLKAGTDGIFGTGDDVAVNDNIIQGDSATINVSFIFSQVQP